ncbi:2Fe-2S iron-sulfur cluster-binding protein [Sphingomonas sp. S1-29]|uniref:2Fe-2S iron-sulfur cluster-binding protein n=1 Tax=Sphingomonas sp. S1-29 TaxID=2991074 RepID=UPI00223ED52D|nr:2Fe-2S iron-sulfur cluster-binding protein [Sphingomonas sp. S1-29]UZK70597.1 2Fe-2S iron-sulfur cluster-binding protein [Sphingomonas sp. S1-29]
MLAQLGAVIVMTVLRYRPHVAPTVDTAPAAPADRQGAWAGLREFRVRYREDEDEALSQTSFYLEPVDGRPLAAYHAGQFLTLQLALRDAQGALRTVTRCYSLSDRHDPGGYRITIKRIPAPPDRPDLPPGLVSNHFHDRVAPGTLLEVRAPAGSFVLDEDRGIVAVLVAGGIGITPLFAMARAALAAQPDRAIHLIYGVRNWRDLVFEAALAEMAERHRNFQVTLVQSCPAPGDSARHGFGLSGVIDMTLLHQVLPPGRHDFYVCGPPPMMVSLIPALRDGGVPADRIHHEAFGPASIGVPEPAVDVPLDTRIVVRFARSGRTLGWTGEDASLLDFAERNGVAVDSGCRSGSCGTCEIGISSGTLRYVRPPVFEPGPGRCLLCVSAPISDLVLEA